MVNVYSPWYIFNNANALLFLWREPFNHQPAKQWGEEEKCGHYQTKDYPKKSTWYPITNILPLNTKRKESNRCRKGEDRPHEKSHWQAEKKCEWFQGASPRNRLQVFLCVFTLNSHCIKQGRNNLRTFGGASKYFLYVQTWCTPMTMLPMEQNVETVLQTTAGQVIPPRARKAMLADKTTVAWSEDKKPQSFQGEGTHQEIRIGPFYQQRPKKWVPTNGRNVELAIGREKAFKAAQER